MRIAVIGAGVIGVTTAYELALDGHEVTVFERRSTAAEEASFANGSLIAPAWLASSALAGKGRGPMSLRVSRPAGLRLAGWPNAAQWGWLWRWQRARQAAHQVGGRAALHRLAQVSQDRLAEITISERLEYDRSQGVLMLWRSEREATLARAALPALREQGAVLRELDAAQARQVEPSLNPDTALVGALEFSTGQTANCRQFTLQLKNLAMARGCVFQFGSEVIRLDTSGKGVTLALAAGDSGSLQFDAAVLCASAAGAALLRPMGVPVPVQSLHGHSISAAIREPLDAPLSAVIDAQHQVSIARLGQRVRVAGGTLLGGTAGAASTKELQRLYRVLMDWFPGAARLGDARDGIQEWRGAQAMVPDGLPLLGESGIPRVWLNLAHGSQGWTLACGCARAVADRLQGRETATDVTAFSTSRLRA